MIIEGGIKCPQLLYLVLAWFQAENLGFQTDDGWIDYRTFL